MDVLASYLQRIEQRLASGEATEHAHRPALEALLEATDPSVVAVNEPTRTACGAPGFSVQRSGHTIGYVEAKDVGRSLDAAETTDQLQRYKASPSNLVLIDYLAFRWFVGGELRTTARLAHLAADGSLRPVEGGAEQVRILLDAFSSQQPEPVTRPQALAVRMAQLTHM
jgi:hypothetical protein